MRTRNTLLAIALLLSTAPAFAAVQVVDCAAGPYFDINSAIEASAPGDTIFIEPCAEPYSEFEVIDKTNLHIVGNGGPVVIPASLPDRDFFPPVIVSDGDGVPAFTCVQITNSERITISNITFDPCDFHAIQITASEDVRILANRFGESFETVRDSTDTGSQITGNLFVGGAFAVFIDGNNALVSQNVILENQGSAISLLTPSATGNQVLANVILRSRLEAIFSATNDARIERNLALENESLTGSIILSNLANDNVVLGNVTDGVISDSGVGNILVGNQ